ncbi:hypothetical protein AAVH_29331 [Aphelenchoides avenae]|nr:hypothetical protein AAVH_29331 [Aphelenchus avenae]
MREVLLAVVVAFAALCVEANGYRLYQPASDPEKVRQHFLKTVTNDTNFKWYKRLAVDLQKKKARKHKKPTVQLPDALKSRVKLLEENGVSNSDGAPSIPLVNRPLSAFLYQGDLLLTEAEAVHLNLTKPVGKNRKAGGFEKLTTGEQGPEIAKWPHDQPICYFFDADTT